MNSALAYLQRYRDNPTHTTYEIQEREEFLAPKLTVCQFPAWNTRNPYRNEERGPLSSFMKKFGIEAEDVVATCLLNRQSCTPGKTKSIGNISSVVDLPTAMWTQGIQYFDCDLMNIRRCFTLHPKHPLGVLDHMSGYFLNLSMEPEIEALHGSKSQWEISIHNDPDWASDLEGTSTVIKVLPRTSNTIFLSIREMLYVPTSTHPCEEDPSYSRDRCWSDCVARNLSPTWDCRLSWMNVSLPLCETVEDIQRFLRDGYNQMNKERFWKLNCNCPQPCKMIQFTTQAMPPELGDSGNRSALVHVYFPSREVEVLVEHESYDLNQMVGELGGCVGLFLGVSLVSVYEIVAGFFFGRVSA
ncbi:unnamed protein product [Darwinula stevensoni]|uniref:Uncharacterized protein n=1 Tax=Darwinula stevensoni TaxID=69355 RepID=A0A7R9A834_9CRUS|nr:unnamed protein product [Darwinula stevensoni]CAG0894959.1 unnamed protein product [Darwinula stevensoni]